MALRRRLALFAVAYLALLLVMGGVALWLLGSRDAYATRQSTASVNVERALRLTAFYVEMESAARGYVISGSRVVLEPYAAAESDVKGLQPLLATSLAKDDVVSYTQLREVIRLGDAWRAQSAAQIAARTALGQAVSEQRPVQQPGQLGFDRLRAGLSALSARLEVDQLAMTRLREMRARQVSGAVIAFPLLGAVYTLLAAVLVSRWVLRPLRTIGATVQRVIGGDLAASIPTVGASDIARLGASVDSMRATMVERLRQVIDGEERANRAREAIEQSTRLALQLRTELAGELGIFPEGWTAAADLLPAEGYLAGDCYDVTLVSPQLLGVIVLDIAGHGAAQAITALKCREILRAALRVATAPGAALDMLAATLGGLESSILTAFVALVDTRTGECRYANAGHPPALLSRKDKILGELGPTGPLMGAFPSRWKTRTAQIEPGGKLCVYTDGLSEARDADDVFYGTGRPAEILVTLPCEVAGPVVEACFDDLRAFRPARILDDVTMVVVCRDCHDPSST